MSRERGRTSQVWRVLVPLTALTAGTLFATSASAARGTDLRAGRFSDLAGLVEATSKRVADQEQAAAVLRREVDRTRAAAAARSGSVAAQLSKAKALEPAAGLQAVRGPGLTVTLDDAPQTGPDQRAASANPNDLVVHQQDVQAVVNALWAGGAEAMTLMGERMVSTTAVRCVGNTLLIQGRLVGPPFVVRAIGSPSALRAALDVEPGVAIFKQYVDQFGLGYRVARSTDLRFPAYDGPLDLPNLAAS